jgi:hypothetical protein
MVYVSFLLSTHSLECNDDDFVSGIQSLYDPPSLKYFVIRRSTCGDVRRKIHMSTLMSNGIASITCLGFDWRPAMQESATLSVPRCDDVRRRWDFVFNSDDVIIS